MSLRTKLTVIILFVALVPLTISALSTLNIHQQAFDDQIGEIHLMSARNGTAVVGGYFDNARRTLKLATRSIRWPELSADERDGALWFTYRQLDDIAVASLLDDKGEGIGASAYIDSSRKVKELSGHPLASMALLQEFVRNLPFEAARKNTEQVAMGRAFMAQDVPGPFIPLAVSVPGPADRGSWIVAVALSLGKVCAQVEGMSSGHGRVLLIDAEERLVCPPELVQVDSGLRRRNSPGGFRYRDLSGKEMLAARAPVSQGWSVVVQQPAEAAFSASRRMRNQTIFWIALSAVIAIVAGLFLGRSISGPVRMLVQGALEIAKGNFVHRIRVEGGDELGRLSETFNYMGGEIEKKNAEIRAWNEELQQRVVERTQQLREVQEQLLQSRKIAAVTSLGAGIAHEINNPLTSVLGLTQILREQADSDLALHEHQESLKAVEDEALRIKSIVGTLLDFTQSYAGDNFSPVNLNILLDETVKMVEGELTREKIEVKRNYDPDLPLVMAERTHLQQVILQLFTNARLAMAGGGQLTLGTETIEGHAVKLMVGDSGRGIAPENLEKIFEPFFTTKDDWRGEGLGLTIAFRIIEEHHGTIKAESTPGEGTTMNITLPSSDARAHIR